VYVDSIAGIRDLACGFIRQERIEYGVTRENELDKAGSVLVVVGILLLAYGVWNGKLSASLVEAATSLVGLGVAAIAGGGVLKTVAKRRV